MWAAQVHSLCACAFLYLACLGCSALHSISRCIAELHFATSDSLAEMENFQNRHTRFSRQTTTPAQGFTGETSPVFLQARLVGVDLSLALLLRSRSWAHVNAACLRVRTHNLRVRLLRRLAPHLVRISDGGNAARARRKVRPLLVAAGLPEVRLRLDALDKLQELPRALALHCVERSHHRELPANIELESTNLGSWIKFARGPWMAMLQKKDLETLRKMPSPPPPVQRCLECIYIALHVEKFKAKAVALQPGKRLHVEWADVQRMLANFQTFYPMMTNFDGEASVDTHLTHCLSRPVSTRSCP